MEIAFHYEGEEVYRLEIPDEAEKVVFSFTVTQASARIDPLPVPVITEIKFGPPL